MIEIDQHLRVVYTNEQVVSGSDLQLAPTRRQPGRDHGRCRSSEVSRR